MKNYRDEGRTLNGQNADMLRNMPCGVVVFGMHERKGKADLLYFSDSFAAMCGLSAAEIENIYRRDGFSGIHPEEAEKIKDYFYKHGEEAHFMLPTFRLKCREGYQWIRAQVKRKQEDSEEWAYYVSCMVAGEEQEWRDALKDAEAESQIRLEYLARISHEIRTPINSIVGIAELSRQNLQNGRPDLNLSMEYNEELRDASAYLLTLVNDIQDMSRLQSGQTILNMEPLDCIHYLENLNALIAPVAKQKGVKYSFVRESEHHRTYIADGEKVQQVVISLLNLAVKNTPAGGSITMTAGLAEQQESTATVFFRIKDGGLGLPEESVTTNYLPGGYRDAVSNGSSLGLIIAKQLAAMMGGHITTNSELGIGTTYEFRFRAGISNEQVLSVDPNTDPEGQWDFTGVHVLVCEDHQVNSMVISRLLVHKGCIVDVAVNGKGALEMYAMSQSGAYDLILMDIRMPEMDGLETTRILRGMTQHADATTVPIVALSANAYMEDIQKSLEAGMDLHLVKPVKPERLYQLVQTCVEIREEREAKTRTDQSSTNLCKISATPS